MGSSISAIYDDHDDYISLCKDLNIESKGLYCDPSFYEHEIEILDNLGFKHIGDYFTYKHNVYLRNKLIKEILE